MPELPEVETIKNNLIHLLKGLKITKVDVLRKTTILGDPEIFKKTIEYKTIEDITRIGKFMIFHLSENVCFISHLRMEGKYYKLEENEADSYYSRVIFHLNDNTKLCYDDSRCFGIMKLTSEKNYRNEKEIAKLGPEPFDIKDGSFLYDKAKNKSIPIKTFLLDQEIMTGLGNIYVDETLFACKIHPLRKPSKLSKQDFDNILTNSKEILKNAIKSGGSTIRSYHPGKGIDGNFQVQLKAYGKEGEPCPNCGHPFRKIKVNGRGTTFCPICQKYHGETLNVAITGPISTGKSTVTNIFKENGYDTISADEIVHELYKNHDVARKIEQLLNIKFAHDEVELNVLREHLVLNPNDKKKLEKYVHPLVKDKIKKFLDNSISKIKVAEVPLLYESKMDKMFDFIIVVTSQNAEKFLIKRDFNKAQSLSVINLSNQYSKYKKEADYIIYNDSDLASLKNKVNQLINKDLISLLD